MQMESQVLQINLDDIIPNRFQPRLSFDDQGLKELSDSIKEHGIIQPLVLRKLGNKYEIIAGERRYKAATMAGLATVPAVISNIDDNKSAEIALVENIQRRDLTPIEEARSYKNLLDKGYLTQEQLAKKMGVSQPAVANKLRLLNLCDEVQQALLEGKISERHARALLVLTNKNDQKDWLNRIISDRMTVRQLDQELKKSVANTTNNETIPLVDINPNIDSIKNNAFDLNSNNTNRNVANMMVPEDVLTDYSEKLPTPTAPTTTSVLDNTTPIVEQSQPINKFFNALESTPVNFDSNNAFSSANTFEMSNNFSQPTPPVVPQTDTPGPITATAPVNNPVEIFDAGLVSNVSTPQDTMTSPTPKVSNPVDSPTQNAMSELNPNNKFFTPISDLTSNATIESNNKSNEPAFDPMSMVNLLDPVAPNLAPSLDASLSQIRETVSLLQNQGLKATIKENDNGMSYQIIIDIQKQ